MSTISSFGQVSRHKQVPITPENMPQGPVMYKGVTFRSFQDLMNMVPIEDGHIWYNSII